MNYVPRFTSRHVRPVAAEPFSREFPGFCVVLQDGAWWNWRESNPRPPQGGKVPLSRSGSRTAHAFRLGRSATGASMPVAAGGRSRFPAARKRHGEADAGVEPSH